MKIAIIGAGFTGLAAGLKLSKAGHQVTLFEKEPLSGGLALSFKASEWKWSLDQHYHHWFTNDDKILALAKEIDYPILTRHPKTSVYVNGKFYKLDSPSDVLKFSELSLFQRLRMGATIAFLKYNPFWKILEQYKVSEFLPKMMGEKPYKTLWEPLLVKKFGPFAQDISLAWFWARIAKRTPSLTYPQGGFTELANAVATQIKKNGGKIIFNKEIKNISPQKNGTVGIDNLIFDKAIVTLPSFLFTQITPTLPNDYKQKLLNLKGISAINLVLRLKKPFFEDNIYWLNVCDMRFPLTAIVEHTNFMDKKYYSNEHLLYLGNYLPQNHPFLQMNKEELLEKYSPLLNRINKDYKSQIIDTHLFTDFFAQPIIPVNYSKIIPSINTPLKNIYLANIQQVYPWDRGTNYAVEMGEKVADFIFEH